MASKFYPNQAGTTNSTFDVGLGKLRLDSSNLTAQRSVQFTDADGTVAFLNSPAFTGAPTAPTPTAGTNTTQLATTAMAQTLAKGYLAKSVAGGVDVTLTVDEAANATIQFTGAITANINVIMPQVANTWTIYNATTGAFTLTVKTAVSPGVAVKQSNTNQLFCNGSQIVRSRTDFDSLVMQNLSLGGSTTMSGNLTFNSTGQRILGDFSNGTVASRLMFQTTTTNATTSVDVIPNGTSTTSQYCVYNNSDPTNASGLRIQALSNQMAIQSDRNGSGTYQPLTILVAASEQMRLDGSNASLFGVTPTNNGTNYRTLSLGTSGTGSDGAIIDFKSGSTIRGYMASNSGAGLQLTSQQGLDMLFYTGPSTAPVERMRLSSSASRVQGDFSNATIASRLLFQTSTTNGNTVVGAVPNGTSSVAQYAMYNNADPTNAPALRIGIDSGVSFIDSFANGAGTQLPLSFRNGGVERFKLSPTENRIQANFSQGIVSSQLMFQDSTTNALTSVGALPNGTGTTAQYNVFNSSSPDNSGFVRLTINGSRAAVDSSRTGSGTFLPLTFNTNDTERYRLDTTGNFLFGTTNSGDPISQRVDGIKMDAGTKAIYSRCNAGWEIGISSTSGTSINFYTDNGSAFVNAGTITSNGSTTAYNTSSDYRLKDNLQPMVGALDSLMQIEFMTWMWKSDGRLGEGVVAHKLKAIDRPIEDAVQGEKDAIDADGDLLPQQVDYSKLVPRIGCSVQELNAKLDAALSIIADLQQRLAVVEAK